MEEPGARAQPSPMSPPGAASPSTTGTDPTALSLPELNGGSRFLQAAGLKLASVSPSLVIGWMELGPDHQTPWGVVHGGVYASAIESATSIGASAAAAERGQIAVGVTNITNFLRPMTAGRVTVTAKAIQQGRTQQLWQVDIAEQSGKLVAIGQVRLQNVEPRA